MSTAICPPDNCHQTLLYEIVNGIETPFLRQTCVDRDGNTTTTNYTLAGAKYDIKGEVVTEPNTASCCHSVTLYEHLTACVSKPFIRLYKQDANGELEVQDYNLEGIEITPTGQISSEPPEKTTTHEKMCDASNRNTFFRWYTSCGNTVSNTYDTDLSGATYTASDATYPGDCHCKPLTLKRELCDTIDADTSVRFYRTSKYNGAGVETSTIDTTPDDESYQVVGTAGICKPTLEIPAPTRIKLCDTYPVTHENVLRKKISSPAASWVLNNNTVISVDGGMMGFGEFMWTDDVTVSFDQPVNVEFGINSIIRAAGVCRIIGDFSLVWMDERFVSWDESTGIVYIDFKHITTIPPDPNNITSRPDYITFKATNITQLTFENPDSTKRNCQINFMHVTSNIQTPFWRNTTYNEDGQTVSQADTALDDTNYTIKGSQSTCKHVNTGPSKVKLCDTTKGFTHVDLGPSKEPGFTKGPIQAHTWVLTPDMTVTNNYGRVDDYGYGLYHSKPSIFTFSRPAHIQFHLFTHKPTTELFCNIDCNPGGSFSLLSGSPNNNFVEWNPATNTAIFRTDYDINDPNIYDPWGNDQYNTKSLIAFYTDNVTELSFESFGTDTAGVMISKMLVYTRTVTPFWRNYTFDEVGQRSGFSDTTLDETGSYIQRGSVMTCPED